MKKLTIGASVFGPYESVEVLADRYRVDGADLPFAAAGEGVVTDWVGPLPVPPQIVVVPSAVTMRQARLALLGAGLLDDVDAAIASIPDATTRKAAQIEWEFSNEVQRFNSFTSMLGGGLGLTAEQVDQLFVQAAAP